MSRARSDPDAVEPLGFDMTPMIDVTFQLIIFFMLVMDMQSVRVEKLTPPSAKSAVVFPPESHELIVNVTADGRLKVAGKVVREEALSDLFASQRRASGRDYPVHIRADRTAAFEKVQLVMAAAQAHGGVLSIRLGAVKEGNR